MVCKSLLLEFLLIFSDYIRRKLNARCILELDIVQTFPGEQLTAGTYFRNTGPTPAFQFDVLGSYSLNSYMKDVVLRPCCDKTLTRNIKFKC